MKKFLLVLVMVSLLLLLPNAGFAADAQLQLFAVKAAQAPVIDGALADGEWENAVEYLLDTDTTVECFEGDGSDVRMLFYLLWDDAGLYLGAQVLDDTVAPSVKAGYALNVTDGVQIGLNPANKTGDLISDAYFFSFVPVSNPENDGPAVWFEHFMLMGAPASAGVLVAGKQDDNGYTVEAFIPWTAVNSKGENFSPAEGAVFGAALTVMDFASNKAQLAGYKTWPGWSINDYNTMVLCADDFAESQEGKEIIASFASAADTAEPDAETLAGSADAADAENPDFSLIVFIFAAILFGLVFIAINYWEGKSK